MKFFLCANVEYLGCSDKISVWLGCMKDEGDKKTETGIPRWDECEKVIEKYRSRRMLKINISFKAKGVNLISTNLQHDDHHQILSKI